MIRIKMLCNVRPDLIFLAKPGTVLHGGETYEGYANRHGAVSGICANGERLGVRPGEFVFVEAPDWLSKIWSEAYPQAVEGLSTSPKEAKYCE